MPLTAPELQLKTQSKAQTQKRAEVIGISPALLFALEQSSPKYSIPQGIILPLSKASQNIYKSLSNLAKPPTSAPAPKLHEHGVPTGLFRLPLDIREQIYGLVLGHKTVLKVPENFHYVSSFRGRSNNGPTSILQTCRQIYAEAITGLYTQNTFHFQNHNDFLAFAHAVNPFFLSRITSLDFDLNSLLWVTGTPYDHQCPRFTINWIDGVEPQWSHLWSIVAAMENLVELNVFLQDPGYPEWDGMECLCIPESDMLADIWKVKRDLKVFEVNVPWVDTSLWSSRKDFQPFVDGARFRLTRRGIHPTY